MGSRRAVLVALVAVSLLWAPACSDGSGDARDVPPDPRTSPESLTEALMLLWQQRDRETADRLGTDEALDVLFAVTPPSASIEVIECLDEPGIAGAKTCLARGGGQRVLVTVERTATANRWRAISILPVR